MNTYVRFYLSSIIEINLKSHSGCENVKNLTLCTERCYIHHYRKLLAKYVRYQFYYKVLHQSQTGRHIKLVIYRCKQKQRTNKG